MNRLANWAIGVVIVLAVLAVIGTLMGEEDAAPLPTPTPTAKAETEVPTPTATRRPRPTPTAASICPSAAEAAWMLELSENLDILGPASIETGALLGLLATDVTLLFSDDWTIAMALQLFLMKSSAEAILDLSAPRSIAKVSSGFDAAARAVIRGVDELIYAIDNVDTEAMDRSTRALLQAESLVTDATRNLEAHCR